MVMIEIVRNRSCAVGQIILVFWELQRKQEASLLVCHQQIRKLESELIEQRTLLEEDEAHLDKYLKSMKSATSHSRKQHKQKVRCSPPHRRDGNLSRLAAQYSTEFFEV